MRVSPSKLLPVKTRQSGFTLIELLVVIAIVACNDGMHHHPDEAYSEKHQIL